MERNSVKKMQKKLLIESKNHTINEIRYDIFKLKENLIDNIYFAIDKDLLKMLFTILEFCNFRDKLEDIIDNLYFRKKTSTVGGLQKIKNEVFELIGILDEIKLDLSCGDIRKKYNLTTLSTKDGITDDQIIYELTRLIRHGFYYNSFISHGVFENQVD